MRKRPERTETQQKKKEIEHNVWSTKPTASRRVHRSRCTSSFRVHRPSISKIAKNQATGKRNSPSACFSSLIKGFLL